MFLSVCRSMLRYRFERGAHEGIHGLQLFIGSVLCLPSALTVGGKQYTFVNGINTTRSSLMVRLAHNGGALAIVHMLYLAANPRLVRPRPGVRKC